MKPICIIPIYSQIGDYRHKHVLYLAGQPLFCHAIDKAKKSQLFEEIIVITDDEIYAEIAQEQDVTVKIYQNQEETEELLINQMIKYVLNDYAEEQSFMAINAAAICIQVKQLIDSYQLYTNSSADIVMTVAPIPSQVKSLINLTTDDLIQSSINLEHIYYPVDAITISHKQKYLKSNKIQAFILSSHHALVIDSHQSFVHVLGENYFDYKVREQNGKSMFYQLYDDKLAQPSCSKVLLGDSRTVNIHLPGFKNFGIGGVTLATLMERIDDILTPDVQLALVSIGVNDFTTKYSFETIKNNFKQLIQICSDRKIRLLLTTIPYTLYRHEVSNSPIREMNQWLKDYCYHQQVPLLDLNTLLSSNDVLKYQYTYDGLHFTEAANRLIEQQYHHFIEENS